MTTLEYPAPLLQERSPPPVPDLELLRLLHRSPDGFVSFGRKTAEGWQDCFSLHVAALSSAPPSVLPILATDSYFSLGTMYRPGHGASRLVPSLPRAYRCTAGLRYLNVCYTDLDVHKQGGDPEGTIQAVGDMVAAGTIPQPSIIIRSGRGVWGLWLLDDPTTGLPPRATEENSRKPSPTFRLYREVQKAIQHRLAYLGADPLALDAARLTRIPDSVHSGAGKVVTYTLFPGPNGKPPTYTLEALAKAFSVPPAPPPKPRPPMHRPVPEGDRKPSGWGNVNRSRLRQLETLEALRGGFPEGCRAFAALLLAVTLANLGKPLEEIERRVEALGENCNPPLSAGECAAAVKSGTSGKYRYYNATIARNLRISTNEVESLETWKDVNYYSSLPHPSSKYLFFERKPKGEAKRVRQDEILRIIQEGEGAVPTVRGLVSILRARGISVSKSTLWQDYKELGLA